MKPNSRQRSDLRSAIAECIQALRKTAGISQERLASASGIDRGYIGKLEKGHNSPKVETIYKMMPAMKTTFANFGKKLDQRVMRMQAAAGDADTADFAKRAKNVDFAKELEQRMKRVRAKDNQPRLDDDGDDKADVIILQYKSKRKRHDDDG